MAESSTLRIVNKIKNNERRTSMQVFSLNHYKICSKFPYVNLFLVSHMEAKLRQTHIGNLYLAKSKLSNRGLRDTPSGSSTSCGAWALGFEPHWPPSELVCTFVSLGKLCLILSYIYSVCDWHHVSNICCYAVCAVARIALVKPEKARGVEDVILNAAQRGQIAEKVY